MPAGTAKPKGKIPPFVRRLSKAGTDLNRIARSAERSPGLVESVIDAIGADAARPKFAASKLLRIISQQSPKLVYPHFGFLVGLLKSENSILKWNAMMTLANLAVVDQQKKLDGIMDAYLAPICGAALVDAANTIKGAAVIARAKPGLAGKIASQVLQVENATYGTPECRNVAMGHAIEALDQFFPLVEDKAKVQSFVAGQVNNTRPATRNKAQKFCKKWPAS